MTLKTTRQLPTISQNLQQIYYSIQSSQSYKKSNTETSQQLHALLNYTYRIIHPTSTSWNTFKSSKNRVLSISKHCTCYLTMNARTIKEMGTMLVLTSLKRILQARSMDCRKTVRIQTRLNLSMAPCMFHAHNHCQDSKGTSVNMSHCARTV